MKFTLLTVSVLACACFLGSCTERRRAGNVEADGDTVTVVIPEKHIEVYSVADTVLEELPE